jgi:hypothetical protein
LETPLATLDVLSARAASEPEGTLAFPVRDHINTLTAMSLMYTDWSWLEGARLDHLILHGSILTMQRNEAVQKMRGKYLIFIDDDMVWPPDAVHRLVGSYMELLDAGVTEPFMVGGLCFRRTPPYQPTLYMREQPTAGQYNFMEEWTEGLVEVDATGMAFVLIPTEVFAAVAGTEMPSYETRQRLGGLPSFFRWDKNFGEDLQFCQDVKAAGARIFVDTRIEIGHVGEVQIGHKDFIQALAQRSMPEYAQRLIVNKRMGLPTVSPTKAKAKLGW